jgi:hypothetical protein
LAASLRRITGQPLGEVRIHDDSTANDLSAALQAKAFTAGGDIFLRREHSQDGRLLAHEAAHAAQQSKSGAFPAGRMLIQREPEAAHLSDEDKRGLVLAGAEQYLSVEAGTYSQVAGGTRRVEDREVSKRLSLYADVLAREAQAFGQQTSKLASLRTTFIEAVDAVIAASAETTKRSIADVYRAHGDEIPIWARPTDPDANALSDKLPGSQRTHIKVITDPVNVVEDEYFSKERGTTTVPLPAGVMQASFAGQIPDSLRSGLSAVAGHLTGGDGSRAVLLPNTTLTLVLDLSRYGGENAAFRCTYVAPGKSPSILIERLGAVGPNSASLPQGLLRSQSIDAAKRFEQHSFRRRGDWSDPDEFRAVLAAVAQVPDAQLGRIDGVTFTRASRSPDPKASDAGGDYDRKSHTIHLYDLAFSDPTLRKEGKKDQTAFGAPGADHGLSSRAVNAILHEIGHAIDETALRKAERVPPGLKALDEYKKPNGSYDFPATKEGAAAYDEFKKLKANFNKAQLDSESLSGIIVKSDPKDPQSLVDDPNASAGKSTAFRQATAKDGGVRITAYGEKSWSEAFAEAYAIYIADPMTLKRLRPSVYAYFLKELGGGQ